MASAADPALEVPLPVGDPDGVRALAGSLSRRADVLADVAARLRVLIGGLLGASWRGNAAAAAQAGLASSTLACHTWATRCEQAAASIRAYAGELEHALALAARARVLLDAAYTAQRDADAADPAGALGRSMAWSGAGAWSYLADPAAIALADQARRAAWQGAETANGAARRLVAVLGELSGHSVSRTSLSPRTLVDVAGFVPVFGDAIDAANGAVHLAQGHWVDGLLSLGGVVPGPPGWAATAGRVGKALDEAGQVVTSATKSDDEILAAVRAGAHPLQLRHMTPKFTAIYRDRDRLIDRARRSTSQEARDLVVVHDQARRKYWHAGDLFELPAGARHDQVRNFAAGIKAFVMAPSTVRIAGSFAGSPLSSMRTPWTCGESCWLTRTGPFGAAGHLARRRPGTYGSAMPFDDSGEHDVFRRQIRDARRFVAGMISGPEFEILFLTARREELFDDDIRSPRNLILSDVVTEIFYDVDAFVSEETRREIELSYGPVREDDPHNDDIDEDELRRRVTIQLARLDAADPS